MVRQQFILLMYGAQNDHKLKQYLSIRLTVQWWHILINSNRYWTKNEISNLGTPYI